MRISTRNGIAAFVIAIAVSLSQLSGASAAAKIATSGSISIEFTNLNETSLKANLPKVKTAGVKKKIQWLRNKTAIKGANKATYTLKPADRGAFLTVQYSLTKTGFKPKSLKAPRKFIQTGVLSGKYELLWQEEFTGAEGANVGSNYWTAQEGDGSAPEFDNPGWGNEERQYYLNDLAKLNGTGQLVISATKTNAANYDCYYGDCHWLSSKIVTYDKVGFLHGRIEVRAKGAKGEGTWPAVWTLGANINEVRWPFCGEIDIMELKGSWPGGLWGTAHGPLSGGPGRGGNWSVTNPSTTEDFHIYAIEWFEDRIDWYVDGKLYYTYEDTDNDWVFDSEQYLILNLAMGGIWGGLIDFDLTDSQFTIDYARYYSINGLGDLITH
jgi:beta-glucanase (GH16 family)